MLWPVESLENLKSHMVVSDNTFSSVWARNYPILSNGPAQPNGSVTYAWHANRCF